MKKILTSLILCATLICGVFVFSACDKDYNLGNLKNDYLKLADGYKEISMSTKCEIQFDYSKIVITSTNMAEIMEQNPKYANINSVYNKLVSNSLYFTTEIIEVCSNNDINVKNKFKNQLHSDIQEVDNKLAVVNENLIGLAEKLSVAYPLGKVSNDDACMARLEDMFDAYEKLIEASLKLSKDLSTLYFNYILEEDNPSYYGKSLDDIDSSVAIASIKNNVCYQVVNLTQNYYNNYVKGSGLSKTIAQGNEDFSLANSSFKDYVDNVHRIVVMDIRTSAGVAIDASTTLKQNFYKTLVKLHNLQAIMKNDSEKYSVASEAISYVKSKNNVNATNDEKMYVELIENYTYIVNEYNETLVELLTIISSVS